MSTYRKKKEEPCWKKTTTHIALFSLIFIALLAIAPARAAQPVFIGVPSNFTIYEDQAFVYYVHANDSDGNYPLNFSVSTDTASEFPVFSITNYNATTGLINFTPLNRDVGSGPSKKPTIIVTDTTNDAAVWTPQFTIENTNDAPNITGYSPAIPTPSINENSTLGFDFTYNASDDDLNHTPPLDNLTNTYYLDGANTSTNISWQFIPGFCDAGNHSVVLVVQDTYNATDNVSWSLTVNNTNRVPVFNKTISNFTTSEETNITRAINLTEHFFDYDREECTGPNKDNLTFTATGNISVRVFINKTDFSVTFSPVHNFYGTEAITFIAQDGYNVTSSNTILINVTNINDPPYINESYNASGAEYAPFFLDINGTDNDTQTLTYYDNTSLFNISSSGEIRFTPAEGSVGNHTINITVSDGEYNVSALLYLQISDNLPPSIISPGNQTLTENALFVLYITAEDQENNNITFSDNTTMFNISSFNSTTGKISFTPVNDDVGNHSIRITATDSYGASNYTDLLFVIADVNNPPVLSSIGTLHARTNNTFTYLINASDGDGESLVFSDNTSLFNVTSTGATQAMINFSPNYSDVGNHSVLINVTDGIYYDYEIIRVSIINNSPPNILNATNISVEEDQNIIKIISVNDTNNDSISFSINTTLFSLRTISPQSVMINWTPDYSDVANHTVRLIVNDGYKGTDEQIFYVMVAELNDTPYWSPPLENMTAFETTEYTQVVRAYDEENDSLYFSDDSQWFNITKINNTAAIINFTPPVGSVGNYTTTINVTDGNTVNSTTIVLRIRYRNDPPSITARYPNSSVISVAENNSQRFNMTGYDPEAQPLYYYWLLNGSLFSTNQTIVYTPGFSDSGDKNLTGIVGDTVHNVSTSWNLTVNNTNRIPVFGKIAETSSSWSSGTFNSTRINNKGLELENNSGYVLTGYFNSTTINLKEDNEYHNITYINITRVIPNGTNISVYTRTSADGSVWDDWNLTEKKENNSLFFVSSANKQYLQYSIHLKTNDTEKSPVVTRAEIHYTPGGTNFNEKTTYIWIDLDDYFSDPDSDDTLTYNVTTTNGISASVESGSNIVRIRLDRPGEGVVQFQATDNYNATTYSNNITLTFDDVPEGSTQSSSNSGGGSGGSSTITIIKTKLINQSANRTSFFTLEILEPGELTIYENQSMVLPLKISNNDNKTFFNISFSALSTNEGLNFSFSTKNIAKLLPGEKKWLNLTILPAKTFGNYDVVVEARTSKPKYADKVKFIVSSIELGRENRTQLNTRIAFTQDLFATNPECLELNELLDDAKKAVAGNRYRTATEFLDQAIDACKYLISKKDYNVDYPLSARGFFEKMLAFFNRIWVGVVEFFQDIF